MTNEIRKLPKVTVEEEMLGEKIEGYCPEGIKLKMKLSIDPDKALITFDYRDMPDQLPWGYNLTYATTYVTAITATLATLGPVIPRNDGAVGHIKVLMKEGSMVGMTRWPASNSVATTSLNDEVTNLACKAWAKVLPERGLAGTGEYGAANFWCSGFDKRTNEPYSHAYYIAAGGAGATEGYDGLSHMFAHCAGGNMGYEFIETTELATPQIIWEAWAVMDSGGPGKWRGGIAGGHRVQPVDHDMRLITGGTGHTCAPFGLFGGLPGAVADHWIIDHATGKVVKHLKNASDTICKSNQRWDAVTGGGGGFGDPIERDPEAVRDDARDGFVSLEAARDIYKVVLNTEPELYEVDYPATGKLRAEAKNKSERRSKNGLQNKC
jgi:N-methylhydantoinase B